ncbi:MAG: GGDEF domain-containing protein [Nitrospinota bacterium]|nr:GGDEF domain-containing protein [Nitrospinota bacterium]
MARKYPSTSDTVKKLLPFLTEKKIKMTPDNYRLFFDYFQGAKDEIVKEVDTLIKAGTHFTPDLLERVYKKFYVRDLNEELTKKVQGEISTAEAVSSKAGEILLKAIKEVIAGIESTSDYGENLSHFSKKAEKTKSLNDLKELLQQLLKDTAETHKQNQNILNKLEDSNKLLHNLNQQLEESQSEARIDTLTKLLNRRSFNESMEKALKYVSNDNKCSLVLIDIDHFKKFNDSFGHIIGDKLLVAVSDKMKKSVTERCTVCRYGGEEFAVICHGMPLDEAAQIADKIRGVVYDWEFTVRGERVPVTVSVGVSELSKSDDINSTVKRADKALYLAKTGGRNRVATETEITNA